MNLYEILLALVGKNEQERAIELRNMGVLPVLVQHIQRCYDEKGQLVSGI